MGRLVLLVLTIGSGVAAQIPQARVPRQPVETSGALQVIVRMAGARGLGGVLVTLHGERGPDVKGITSGDGLLLLRDIPPGNYTLLAAREAFSPFSGTVEIAAGVASSLEITMTALGGETSQRPAPEPEAVPGFRELVRRPSTTEPPGPPEPGSEIVFEPSPDRWHYRLPNDARTPPGHWYDPFNRNPLKGDYPILGDRTFFDIDLVSTTFIDGRRLPTPSNVPSARPDSSYFFGQPGQFFLSQNFAFTADLFHGDTAFRPADWRIRITPEINVNYFAAKELGIVDANPLAGNTRFDTHIGLQEAFAEVKLKDLSNDYDFISARAGIQSFSSDFRGFIFSDQEPGLRIFGNLGSNRYQYNVAAFAMLEKDTNSALNRFKYRNQQVFVANVYRQDFLRHGYTIQASVHYDKDDGGFQFDRDNFLVRPAPVGVLLPHAVQAWYYGFTGDGHLGRLNVNHAFYQVLGHDTLNPIAGRREAISARMAALELSVDRDWLRYRASFFYASGDRNPTDGVAHGFDGIFDKPDFAGGIFSFWNREGIRLTGSGLALTSPDSLSPSLRSSKIEGQANFVNPGLMLWNAGVDADVTPKLRAVFNLNVIRFARTDSLEYVLFQSHIHAGVGTDSGIGFTYRPKLSENISVTAGFNAFFPFQGFRDIYSGQTLLSVFTSVRFRF